MSDFLSISEIDSRRKRLGVGPEEIYSLAGVSRATWHRAVNGSSGTRVGALQDLATALVTLERGTLAHLIALHPETAAELLAAVQADKQVAA